jgi:hypothetical protein
MIKLNYIDHISPHGVLLKDIGRIHSPFLGDVLKLGYYQYQRILVLMMYTPEKYFSDLAADQKVPNPWDALSNDEKNNILMFDILTMNEIMRNELMEGLSIFVSGNLEWDGIRHAFLIDKQLDSNDKSSVGGYIDRTNYSTVVKVILQMMDISVDDIPEEAPKFKTEKDRLFYEKFQAKKKKFAHAGKSDPNFELPNMISLLCGFHPSINYSNICSLTVGQIRDSFSQLLKARQYNIADMNYSVWGGKHDPSKWIERIDKKTDTIGG